MPARIKEPIEALAKLEISYADVLHRIGELVTEVGNQTNNELAHAKSRATLALEATDDLKEQLVSIKRDLRDLQSAIQQLADELHAWMARQ